ncbi:hypothetical protein D3C78_1528550 [compost metagenome]
MARAVAAVAQPVQGHAEALQVAHRGGVLGLATQQADGGEAEAGTGGGQRMEMIGMGAAQADHAFGAVAPGLLQMGCQLEPLVAGHQRVEGVQAQHGQLQARIRQPGQAQGFEDGAGVPVRRNQGQGRVRWRPLGAQG